MGQYLADGNKAIVSGLAIPLGLDNRDLLGFTPKPGDIINCWVYDGPNIERGE